MSNEQAADREALQTLTRQVDALLSHEQIRTCIYRVNRGMDRIDGDLLASGFFEDAKIRWGSPDYSNFADWLAVALKIQATTQRVQHLVGNILIDLKGDEAHVESYEIGRHLTPMGEEMKDLILASRYVDKFERRQGEWRIVLREKVVDWIRIMEGEDPAYNHIPKPGSRDEQDTSFEIFGKAAFHDLI